MTSDPSRASAGRGFPLSRALLVLVVALLAWLVAREPARSPPAGAVGTLDEAIRSRRSGVWVEGEGRVERVLADDTQGARHQRLLLDVGDGRTVLLVHNIDLAPRVPAVVGDVVRVCGEFLWSDLGGRIHWTHHDPDGRRPGGWVRHDGTDYR